MPRTYKYIYIRFWPIPGRSGRTESITH